MLQQHIGRGGCSIVYKCKDSRGNMHACKRIMKNQAPKELVSNEIEIMERLNRNRGNANIIRLIDRHEDDDAYLIVQELCAHGSLFDHMHTLVGHEADVQRVIVDVLKGLDFMHDEHGIVHADIKPGNILLSSSGTAKIGDFGTSFDMSSTNTPRKMVGTPWYMAPETLTNNQFSFQSDIWSIGIVTFQLITGRLPFDDYKNPLNANIVDIWQSVLMDTPEYYEDAWSAKAIDFTKTCLSKDVDERFGSCKDCLKHPWITS